VRLATENDRLHVECTLLRVETQAQGCSLSAERIVPRFINALQWHNIRLSQRMRVLLVKTSSFGDLLHTMPAVTDAAARISNLRIDWVVEKSFAEVPTWHPAVDQVIAIDLRRWRKDWGKAWRSGAIREFKERLQATEYDLVLDAQGLIKSALPAKLARGPLVGYDRHSIRDPWASVFYRHKCAVSRKLHAIERVRRLFAQAFGYQPAGTLVDYGLHLPPVDVTDAAHRLVFLHGTTWPSKHWPEPYWAELLYLAALDGFEVQLPWGDPEERLRAERIINAAGSGVLLPKLALGGLAATIVGSAGVVGVDSGLAHLAAALEVPAITLYGPTDVTLTGALGRRQKNLAAEYPCAPCLLRDCKVTGTKVTPACFQRLPPPVVWQALRAQISANAAW